jgi:hypothetical protein
VTAVAVWTYRPTAQELLDARTADGWQPRYSSLREGQQILGYAACLIHNPQDAD